MIQENNVYDDVQSDSLREADILVIHAPRNTDDNMYPLYVRFAGVWDLISLHRRNNGMPVWCQTNNISSGLLATCIWKGHAHKRMEPRQQPLTVCLCVDCVGFGLGPSTTGCASMHREWHSRRKYRMYALWRVGWPVGSIPLVPLSSSSKNVQYFPNSTV